MSNDIGDPAAVLDAAGHTSAPWVDGAGFCYEGAGRSGDNAGQKGCGGQGGVSC